MSKYTKIWLTVGVTMLGIIFGLSLIFAINNFKLREDICQSWNFLSILGVICLVPILIEINKKNSDIFEPIYLFVIGYFLHFFLKPIDVIYLGGWLAKAQKCSIEDVNRVIFFAIIGIIFFYIGYYSKFGSFICKKIAEEIPPGRFRDIRYSHRIANILAIIMILIGMGAFLYYVFLYGDFYFFYTHMTEIVEQTRGLGPLLVIIRMFPIIAILIFYVNNVDKMTILKKLFILVSLILLVIVSWQRQKIIAGIIGLVCIRNFLVKKVKFNAVKFVIAITVIIFILIIGLEVFVTYRRHGPFVFMTMLPRAPEVFFHDAMRTFNPTEGFMIIARDVPDVLNYQYGKTYLDMFILPIPRKIWPTKPLTLGANGTFGAVFFPNLYIFQDVVLATTILGEGYMNFGIFGLVFPMFLAGIFLKMIWKYLSFNPKSKHRVLIYSALYGHLPIFIRSGFYTYFTEELQLIVPLLICIFLMTSSRVSMYPARNLVSKL